MLAEKIKEIAKGKKIKVGISKIGILSAADCAMAQATMNEDEFKCEHIEVIFDRCDYFL